MKPTILLILLSLFFLITPAAEASFCRTINHHNICIIRIKRSAKYHWEYRAQVSIDGKKKTTEIYNCRDRYIIRADKTTVPFQSDGVGQLICSLF